MTYKKTSFKIVVRNSLKEVIFMERKVNVGEIIRFNVFHVNLVVRHTQDGKMYLYDLVNIKKETSNLFQP